MGNDNIYVSKTDFMFKDEKRKAFLNKIDNNYNNVNEKLNKSLQISQDSSYQRKFKNCDLKDINLQYMNGPLTQKHPSLEIIEEQEMKYNPYFNNLKLKDNLEKNALTEQSPDLPNPKTWIEKSEKTVNKRNA